MPGRDRDRRAAARAARDPGRVVRVARLRARHAERELVRGRLAEDHGAGRAPEVDAVGVVLGDVVVGVRAAAGRTPRDVDDVLDRDRDAVQRAAPAAGAAARRRGRAPRPARPRRSTSTNAVHSSCAIRAERVLGERDAGGLAGVQRARRGGDRAGLRQPAERGQRRGGGAEDLVGGPPLGRVDRPAPFTSRSQGGAAKAVGRQSLQLMDAPPRTCARAARPRGAPRPRRERSMCTRISAAAASARPARTRRGSPGAPRSSRRSGPAS